MKNYYILLLALCPIISEAQISLNSGMAPPLGSMFFYYDANSPSPLYTFSKSGTSNTWDFTTITPLPVEEDTVHIVDPATVPGNAAFPTATHSIREQDSPVYTMLEVNATAATFLGGTGDILGIGIPFSSVINPPFQAMLFPWTYGNTSNGNGNVEIITSGASIGQPTIDSIRYKSNITADHAVLASGDMVLPSGTFPALLERQINTTIDSAWIKSALTFNQWVAAPGFPTTTTDSAFYWYSDQSLQKYAHVLHDDTGVSDVVFFKSSTTGTGELSSLPPVSLFPNPANSVVYFSGQERINGMQLQLFDINGKEVLRNEGSMDKLNISMLQSGIYFIRLTSSDGQSASYRIVKD